ncbi:hypothetical protein KAU11_01915, partial [Candidatus Babeliales bacterium]|nr:hypothetical protein [Candidatus Babeliales bacterium]
GTKPIVVNQVDKTKFHLVDNVTDGSAVISSIAFREFDNATSGVISAVAGGVIGSDTYVFASAYATGIANFSTTGGTVRAFKRNGTTNTFDEVGAGTKKVMKIPDVAGAPTAYKEGELFNEVYASDGVQELVGDEDILYVKDMHWDSTLERLFIGLELNSSLADSDKQGVLIGRIASATDAGLYTNVTAGDLLVEGCCPLAAIGAASGSAHAIATNDTFNLLVNKVKTMHTSTGFSYLITQADIDDNDNAVSAMKVFALPIVDGSTATANNIGKLAKVTASTNIWTADPDAVAGVDEVLIGNHASTADSVPGVVGGGVVVPTSAQTSDVITDMQVVGDTVFVTSTSGGTGELGIFASTAIFSKAGTIQAWTSWTRVGGVYTGVYHMAMDTATGNIWHTYQTTDAADTVGLTQWFGGNAAAGYGLAELRTTTDIGIDNSLPITAGGVYSATHFGAMTPGLYNGVGSAGHSWIVFTGNKEVVAARTGGGTQTAPALLPTVPGSDYSATYVEDFTDAALGDLGEVYCSEFARDGAVANTGWLFAGGQNGLAVWSVDASGAGWAAGSGLANAAGLGTATFKKLAGITGPVYAMRADGVNLYVMTDKQLLRIPMAANKFDLAVTAAIGATVIYQCAADEWMLCMEPVAGSNDASVVEARGYLATTKGLYFQTDWTASISATNWQAVATTVPLPTGKGPVLGMKFLQGTQAAAAGSVIGNLYVLVGSLAKNEARLYRYSVTGTSAAANGLIEPTVLDSNSTNVGAEIFTVYDTSGLQENFGALRYNCMINGVGFTGLSKTCGCSTVLNTFPLGTGTTPTETAAAFDLALGHEPMYFADLVHNTANGALIAAGSFGVRFQE